METLYGIIFLSHQLVSFVDIWLGEIFYDIYSNYNTIWWISIDIGAFSAIIYLPVKEMPLSNRLTQIF